MHCSERRFAPVSALPCSAGRQHGAKATSAVATVKRRRRDHAIAIGFVTYAIINVRAGRAEVSSEIELAPNRKPYYDDEALEGPRLTRALGTGFVLMAITAIGLPLYWLNEPGRQSGADRELRPDLHQPRRAALRAHRRRWVQLRRLPRRRGRRRPGAAVHAHRRRRRVRGHRHLAGAGHQHRAAPLQRGGAPPDPRLRPTGHPDAGVGRRGWWPAHHPADRRAHRLPRLDPAHLRRGPGRRSRPPCGRSSGLARGRRDRLRRIRPSARRSSTSASSRARPAAAYSCARCHTKGASFLYGAVEPADADLSEYAGYPDGTGAFGSALTSGVVPRQFLDADDAHRASS